MSRKREFDEDTAVSAATEVFWRLGFESTSLTTLLEAMTLSKSSFYQTFESKDALFERCVSAYSDQLFRYMRSELASAPSGLEFVRAMLLSAAGDGTDERGRWGCLVMNTAAEIGQRKPSVADLISHQIGRFEDVFSAALKRAKQDGEWTTEQSVRPVARYLVCTLSGLKTMSKAGATSASIRTTANLAMGALK